MVEIACRPGSQQKVTLTSCLVLFAETKGTQAHAESTRPQHPPVERPSPAPEHSRPQPIPLVILASDNSTVDRPPCRGSLSVALLDPKLLRPRPLRTPFPLL